MSNPKPLTDLRKFPAQILKTPGVLVLGDLHANPLKLIYSLIESAHCEGLAEQDYAVLAEIYLASFNLAKIYYDANQKLKTAAWDRTRCKTQEDAITSALLYRQPIRDRVITKNDLTRVQGETQKANDAFKSAQAAVIEAAKAFLDHLRAKLPAFMARLRHLAEGSGQVILRSLGDDQCDRGACDIWIRAVFKILVEKKLEFDLLMSNHGIVSCIHDPELLHAFDRGKFQAFSGITMQLVEQAGQDILQEAGLQNFMSEICFPRLKLGAYQLDPHNKNTITIDYHAPIDLKDIVYQSTFLGLPVPVLDTVEHIANAMNAINQQIRTYATSSQLGDFIAFGDFSDCSEQAQDYIRQHNPINFAIWNRGIAHLNRETDCASVTMTWRHGHETTSYTNPQLVCLNTRVGQFDQWTQDETDEKQGLNMYAVTEGITEVSSGLEAQMEHDPRLFFPKRMKLIIAGWLQSQNLNHDEKFLFTLDEQLKLRKTNELLPYLKSRLNNLRQQIEISEKSPYIEVVMDLINEVERYYPGLSFLYTLKQRSMREFGHYVKGRGKAKCIALIKAIDDLELSYGDKTPIEIMTENQDTKALHEALNLNRLGKQQHRLFANSYQRVRRVILTDVLKDDTLKFLHQLNRRLKVSNKSEIKRREIEALISILEKTSPNNLEALCRLKTPNQFNLLSALNIHRKSAPLKKNTHSFDKFCEYFDLVEILGQAKIDQILEEGKPNQDFNSQNREYPAMAYNF